MEFLAKVQEFKNASMKGESPEALRASAEAIFQTFCESDGSMAINISGPVQDNLRQHIIFSQPGDVAATVFDEAVSEITIMLERDAGARFKQSGKYQVAQSLDQILTM